MFIYFCRVKICALGFNEFLENIFSLLLVVEAFFLHKVVRMLEAVAVIWQDVRWIWWMRQNFVDQFIQLLKRWLCDMWSGVVEKNWVFSVDQCQLLEMQFSVHLIDLLSILLRCNGFTEIQESLVDQRVSNQQQWPWPFFGASLDFGSALELFLSPTTELFIALVV